MQNKYRFIDYQAVLCRLTGESRIEDVTIGALLKALEHPEKTRGRVEALFDMLELVVGSLYAPQAAGMYLGSPRFAGYARAKMLKPRDDLGFLIRQAALVCDDTGG